MKIDFITLFPDMISDYFKYAMPGSYLESGNLKVTIKNLRDYGIGSYKQVDDYAYGSGKSMLLKYDVLKKAMEETGDSYKVLLSPKGNKFDQKKAQRLSKLKNLCFICGRYEGFDARIYEDVDEILSVGDYVLNGGELPALCIAESLIRLQPDFSKQSVIRDDSFNNERLEHDSYTRPYEISGKKAPDVLVEGNHQKIKDFYKKSSVLNTIKIRPDIFKNIDLTEKEINFLVEYINEEC